jgi:hypothetical protein
MDAADWQPAGEIAHPSLGAQGAQHVTDRRDRRRISNVRSRARRRRRVR